MMTHDPTLWDLLDDSLAYPPEYREGLSSHLPMALAALAGIGADRPQMRRFFDRYRHRFDGPAAASPVAPHLLDDWRQVRGDLQSFGSLTATVAAALARDGRDAVLRMVLPDLLTGVGAAAFHGVIRVAHGVESGHDGELAAGLAYWAARWLPLDPPRAPMAPIPDVAAWLAAIDDCRATEDAGWRSDQPLIALRMVEATGTMAYRRHAGALHGEPAFLLDGLARATAAHYARSRDFTMLHLATGTRALSVLAPWIGDHCLVPVWHAVAAAYLTVRAMDAPPVNTPVNIPVSAAPRDAPRDAPVPMTVPDLTWADILAIARTHHDDHVIKLVHAMAWQQAHNPDPVWLRAAVRAVSGP